MICLDAIRFLVSTASDMRNNASSFKRLCQRTAIFEDVLGAFQATPVLITPALRPSVAQLAVTLKDLQEYTLFREASIKNNIVTRMMFRKERAEDIGQFNARLNDCAQNLVMVQGIDAAVRRDEDLDDLKTSFEESVRGALDEITQQHTSDDSLLEALSQLQSDIADNRTAMASFMIAMRHTEPLSASEAAGVEAMMDDLCTLAAARHAEVMSKLVQVEAKVDDVKEGMQEVRDIVLQIAQSMGTLTADQERIRAAALLELRVSPEALVVDTDSLIGQGTFGTVYEGTYHGGPVAVKVISLKTNGALKQKEAENEILMMKQLCMPLILACYGYVVQGNQMKIILDFAPFGSLDVVLQNPSVPSFHPSLLLAWLGDVIGALRFMHSKGVRHRDVKPANILVFDKFRAKLSDFGLAKQHAKLQTHGSVVGTPAFMAPEVRDGASSDFAADIFSWGVTAINAFTRCSPACTNMDGQAEQAVEGLHIEYGKEELITLLKECLRYDANIPSNDLRPTANQVLRRFGELMKANGGDPRDMKTLAHKQSFVMLERALIASNDTQPDDFGIAITISDSTVPYYSGFSPTPKSPSRSPSRPVSMDMRKSTDAVRQSSSQVELPSNVAAMSTDVTFKYLPAIENPALARKCLEVLGNASNEPLPASAVQCAAVVEAMLVHGCQDLAIAEAGLSALKRMSAVADNRPRLATAGVFVAVFGVMKSFISNRLVVVSSCCVTRHLCRLPENRALAATQGAIEAVMLVQRAHPEAQEVVDEVIVTLSNLACDADMQLKIAKANGFLMLVDIMRLHGPTNPGMMKEACGLLRNLSIHLDNREAGGKAGTIEALVQVIRRHLEVVEVVEQGMAALGNLAANTDSNQLKVVDAGGMELILEAFAAHENQPSVIVQTCWTLRNLTNRTDIRDIASQLGAVGAIMHVLQSHFDSAEIVEQAMAVISNFAHSPSNKVIINESCGFEMIVEAWRKFKQIAPVITQACLAMRNFLHLSANRDKEDVAIIVEMVLQILRLHINVWDVAEHCIGILVNVIGNSESNRPMIADTTAIVLVVEAVKKHRQKSKVMLQACMFMRCMLFRPDYREKAAVAGLIEALIKVLQIHIDSPIIMEQGAAALGNLALAHDNNRLLISKVGGIDVTIEIMKVHGPLASVMIPACAALQILLQHAEGRKRAGTAATLEVIFNVIQFNNDSLDVLMHAIGVLGRLDFDKAMLQAINLKPLLDVFRNHASRPILVSACCGALRTITTQPDCREIVGKAGAVVSIISALRANANDQTIAEQAVSVLGNISANPESNTILVAEAGGIEAILSALVVHEQSQAMAYRSCVALRNLMFQPANRTRAVHAGAVMQIVKVLLIHTDAAEVAEQAIGVLVNLAANFENNKAHVVECGSLEAIVGVMRKHCSSKFVMATACMALRNLLHKPDINAKARAASSGALLVTLDVLRVHILDPQIVEHGCAAMWFICDGEHKALIKELKQAGAVELLRQIKHSYPSNVEILKLSTGLKKTIKGNLLW